MTPTTSATNFKSELRMSATPAALVVMAVSLLGIAAFRLQPFWALLLVGASAVLGLNARRPVMAKALLVATLTVSLTLGAGRGLIPGGLALLAIPVGIAGALIGLPAAAMSAAAAGALIAVMPLLGLPAPGIAQAAIAVVVMLGMLGVLIMAYRPFDQFVGWAEDYYQRTQQQLTDALDAKLRLEQALTDLTHASRQLTLLNDRLAALRAVAEEAQKTKTAFVAKVSHEFRTPLNMIIGLVDILMRSQELYGRKLPPAVIEDLGIIYRNCEHLASMIDDVLSLSQAEAGQLALHREPADLAEIIAEAATVVKPLIQKKGLWLKIEVADLPAVYCDRTRIRQVILNLLSNAACFTETGGITVRGATGEGCVTVSVADTGPGIAPQDMTRIFEPFCQGSQPLWRDRSGSGLGLSISKQFVEMHGGRIGLESRLGEGTVFEFELPIEQPLERASQHSRWLSEAWVWLERDRRPAALPVVQSQPCVLLHDPEGALRGALEGHTADLELIQVDDWRQVGVEAGRTVAHLALVGAPTMLELVARLHEASQTLQDTPIAGCVVAPHTSRLNGADVLDILVKPIRRSALLEAVSGVSSGVRRILIADDDAEVVRLWTRMLQTSGHHYEITVARDGTEALAKLRAEQPDLLLLDMLMPGLDGKQVLEQKGLDPACHDIPVILVSAQDLEDEPAHYDSLTLTWNQGFTIGRVLACSLAASAVMLGAAPPPVTPEETAPAG